MLVLQRIFVDFVFRESQKFNLLDEWHLIIQVGAVCTVYAFCKLCILELIAHFLSICAHEWRRRKMGGCLSLLISLRVMRISTFPTQITFNSKFNRNYVLCMCLSALRVQVCGIRAFVCNEAICKICDSITFFFLPLCGSG